MLSRTIIRKNCTRVYIMKNINNYSLEKGMEGMIKHKLWRKFRLMTNSVQPIYCSGHLVDGFYGSFLRYFETNCKFKQILVCFEHFGKARLVDNYDGLLNVSWTHRRWVDLPGVRWFRFGVKDGHRRHESVGLVSFSQHQSLEVELVVLQTQTQSKCFIPHVKNLSFPGCISIFIFALFQIKIKVSLGHYIKAKAHFCMFIK